MADVFLFLVYIGGATTWDRERGFWSAMFWPYHVGAGIARNMLKEPSP